ncbi:MULTISPECIES: non-ribosomal peptide synthetase [Actinoalloteichus]|uniref:Phosphopantetheine-containing protein n=1 Tax=Actinoalloteichus fjordicus TaxID=1612552 RepID=A0AAC9LA11_9PSEU|nr:MULTISPECIES: non-ribosomal peptide synthetase [Actinoalloteichus]APU13104.1 phosphopantetheine-containing protein [Actinoalloteichus fjordicus]APU19055.1 phosphopantetheine-containing protein [Actinoalloteichus sp. GBA129-24]
MSGLSLLEQISDIAASDPRRPAVRAGEGLLDYGEVMSTVTDLRDQLRAQGVGPEDVVATVLPRGGNPIIAMLAIWMAGAAYLPVDVKWPERRRELVLGEVATFALEMSDGEAHGGMPGESGFRIRRLREGHTRVDGASATERNLAYVLCTSGSTGTPLAVGVEFGALDNYARYLLDLVRQPALHSEGDLRVLLSADLAFDASLRPVLLLAAGAELIVAPDLTEGSWQDHIDCIAEHKVTVLSGVPSWYSGLLGAGYVPGDSAVQLAFIGGEAVPNGVVRQLAASQSVVVQYGPTETTVAATGGRLVDDEFLEAPIGVPVPGAQIQLYRNVEFDPAIDGEPAYLYVGGAGVARGYLSNPRLTAERFTPNPSGPPGSRLFRTGDLAKVSPQGAYSFLGRSDDQVKISGRRIELSEISTVLNRHPAVAQSVAFVDRDSPNPLLVACYVGDRGAAESGEEAGVREYLARELPSYEVPAVVRRVESMPMTERGKVDVPALARLVKPAETDARDEEPDDPAMTDVEKRVIAIVRSTLDLRCSLDDEFFTLGLSSLDSLNILAQIREELGVRVRLRDFFQARTTRNLCKLIGDVS